MAASDARPMPLKNTAYRVYFPILDADGDLVTGAAGLDSEVSKDGGTFADCTNEATEIATSSGMYYLDLTSTEMNADAVCVIVKASTSGAKTTPIVLYPVEGGDIDVDVTYIGGVALSTSTAQLGVNVVQAGGTAWGSGAITAGALATGAITAAKFAAGAIDADAFAAGAITASVLATGAVDADVLATDAVTEIVAAVWNALKATYNTAGTMGNALNGAGSSGDPWGTALPGAYAAGTAGKILGDKAFNASQIGGSTAAADNLARGGQGLVRGKFVTGALSATSGTTDLTGWGNGTFNGRILTITTGNRAGEQRTISDHVETNGVLTFAALTGAPANNDEFYIA